jgi:hypothetical protein
MKKFSCLAGVFALIAIIACSSVAAQTTTGSGTASGSATAPAMTTYNVIIYSRDFGAQEPTKACFPSTLTYGGTYQFWSHLADATFTTGFTNKPGYLIVIYKDKTGNVQFNMPEGYTVAFKSSNTNKASALADLSSAPFKNFVSNTKILSEMNAFLKSLLVL